MSATPISNQPYQAGGALPANASSYVIRQADTELCEGLRAMKFCYVFNSRQMGKSSLRVRAMKTLTEECFACVAIEMRDICSHQVTEEAFYATIVSHLASGFELEIDEGDWWYKHEHLPPFERLSKFFQDELIGNVNQNIIIFIDEIDSIINLEFKDDFFWFIRACYNKRADNPQYDRITFALLGVATPSDLIEDNIRTPFNIDCRAIELTGFHLHEANPLQQGLQKKSHNPQRVLKVVLDWTSGQPFLTQKLCKLISESAYIEEGDEEKAIGELVRSHIINNWLTQDNPEHLRTIRDRILRSKQGTNELLKLYHKIRQRKEVTADDTRKQIELRLSGLVVNQNGKLKAYNRIYESVFDLDWINKELKILQPNSPATPAWTLVAASVVVTVLVMSVRQLGMLQTWELQAFDHLIWKLPPEPTDKRLLIIGADETDISRDGYGHPLPDAVLAQLLDKLQAYQPSAIGLDIVRDQPVSKDNYDSYNAFSKHLKQNKKLITVCGFGGENTDNSIRPPKLSTEMKDNAGFVDLYSDKDLSKQDDTVRRYLLSRSLNPKTPTSPCTTPYSFVWQLVYLYLDARKTPVKTIKYDWKFGSIIAMKLYPNKGIHKNHDWKFGSIIAKRLDPHSGGYQNLDARGNQLLINYRRTSDPQKIAQQVTVRDVLTNSSNFDPAWVKDRVVLIGVTAASIQDSHNTPFGTMRGLFIHAHVVSQILSAVEDNRPLLWWLPQWGDTLWILFWSCTGGIIVWRLKAPLHQGIAISIFIIVLYSSCWIVLKKGGWIPLIPSGLALVSCAGGLTIYKVIEAQKHN